MSNNLTNGSDSSGMPWKPGFVGSDRSLRGFFMLCRTSHVCQMSFPALEVVLFLLWFWSQIPKVLAFPDIKQIVYNKCPKYLFFWISDCFEANNKTHLLLLYAIQGALIFTHSHHVVVVLIFYALGMVLWRSNTQPALFLLIPCSSPIQNAQFRVF